MTLPERANDTRLAPDPGDGEMNDDQVRVMIALICAAYH
jgi:hypothetical protein